MVSIVTHTKETDPRFRLLLYGQSGIGKTTFGVSCHSKAGKSLLLATERGYSFQDVDVAELGKWQDYVDAINTLPLETYETTVIDTALGLADLCQEAVCKKLGIIHPADLDRGKAYDQIALDFGVWLHRLETKTKNLVWITPERPLKIRSAAGREVTRIVPDMPTSSGRLLYAAVDLIGHAEEGAGGKRVISFIPSADTEAKDKRNKVPDGVFALDGASFYGLFNKEK